jgi:hypothetical protein
MWDRLERKIEAIQSEPESVRQRYLIACLVVSMLFMSAIWLITLKENFRGIESSGDELEHLTPDTKSLSAPSLEDLMKGGTPLDPSSPSDENPLDTELRGKTGTPNEAAPLPAPVP